eukprot:gene1142-10656_t
MSELEGGYMHDDTQSTPKKKITEENPLTPLTIRQVLECEPQKDEYFKLYNHEVSLVKIVGKVVEISEELPNSHIIVEDKTGMIEVGFYNSKLKQDITVNQYVRIFGKMRCFKGKFSINGYDISRVTDFNEVAFHQLKVVQNYCFLNGLTSSNATQAKKKINFDDETVDDLEITELSPLGENIMKIVRKCKEKIGIHQDKIFELLGDSNSTEDITAEIIQLHESGYIGSEVQGYLQAAN